MCFRIFCSAGESHPETGAFVLSPGSGRSPSGLVEFEPVKGPGITEGEKGR